MNLFFQNMLQCFRNSTHFNCRPPTFQARQRLALLLCGILLLLACSSKPDSRYAQPSLGECLFQACEVPFFLVLPKYCAAFFRILVEETGKRIEQKIE